MSSVLKKLYNDLASTKYTDLINMRCQEISEDIEMKTFIPWSVIDHKEKKNYILSYMKNNNIKGDISMYTFKNICFNKKKNKITSLTYYIKQ